MPPRKPKKEIVKKLWNFKKQGYPPGIDPEWAENERLAIMKEAKRVFGKKQEK